MIKTSQQYQIKDKIQPELQPTLNKHRKSSVTMHDIEALQQLHLQKMNSSRSSSVDSESQSPNKKEKQQKWQAAKEANTSMESDDSISKHTFIDVHIFR